MNLLEMITESGNGAVIGQIAQQLGIGPSEARVAAAKMLPALGRGIQKNAASPSGLAALLGALGSGNHSRYVDRPEELAEQSTIDDGNSILGHILGSKDVSRNIAGHAAQETGLDAGILKQMLPMLAAAAMGAMNKQTQGSGALSGLLGLAGQLGVSSSAQSSRASQSSPAMNMLSGFLDADKDGSIVDDLLGMAKKFF